MHGLYNYSGKIEALVLEIRYFALTCQVGKKKCCFLWCCYWGLALQQGFYTCQKWEDPHWQTLKNTLESAKIWCSYLIPQKHVSIHHHFSTFQPSHPMCKFKTINVLFWILKVKDNL
jgi:hypothetical protein